jgi:hypothetical protein
MGRHADQWPASDELGADMRGSAPAHSKLQGWRTGSWVLHGSTKSYGRAPTLLLTGYGQVRSITAATAGDMAAAAGVWLVVHDTGVSTTRFFLGGIESPGFYGAPAPAKAATCWLADVVAKE